MCFTVAAWVDNNPVENRFCTPTWRLQFGPLVSTLLERAEAALQVIGDDPEADRMVLLSYVVWPTQAVAQAAPVEVLPITRTEVGEMAALVAQGWTHRRIGEHYRKPRSTISAALQRRDQRLLTAPAVTV